MSAYQAIASTTLSTPTATVTFSSIPATFEHLQLRLSVQCDNNVLRFLSMRFNNDTGSNYWSRNIDGTGTTPTAASSAADTSIGIAALVRTNTSFSAGVVNIPDYAGTNKFKNVNNITGNDNSNTGYLRIVSGQWISTAAINRIDLFFNSNQFDTGSVIALYGLTSTA